MLSANSFGLVVYQLAKWPIKFKVDQKEHVLILEIVLAAAMMQQMSKISQNVDELAASPQ